MSTVESTAPPAGLADAIRARLQDAAGPLKLADIAKGLPRPRRVKLPEFQDEVRQALEEQVRQGRAFRYPSAKEGMERYWTRDEKDLLRGKALESAASPQPLSVLKAKLVKEIKGVDGAFVESVVRELVSDGKLFEYRPKAQGASAKFGATPPPPALELPRVKRTTEKLVTDARKLLASAGVSADELLHYLGQRLSSPAPAASTAAAAPVAPPAAAEPELDGLILKVVANEQTLSLADLREMMAPEFRDRAFDEAVLRLAAAGRVSLSQDAAPASIPEQERAKYVQDGPQLYTKIARRD